MMALRLNQKYFNLAGLTMTNNNFEDLFNLKKKKVMKVLKLNI